MFTHWHCLECKKESTVQHHKDKVRAEVLRMMGWQHQYKSPRCHSANGLKSLRDGFPNTSTGNDHG